MAELSTLTAELPGDTRAKLARLSERTGRGSSAILGEAIATSVDRELAIVEAIEEGLADMRAGRVHTTDEAFAEAEAIIEEARTDK